MNKDQHAEPRHDNPTPSNIEQRSVADLAPNVEAVPQTPNQLAEIRAKRQNDTKKPEPDQEISANKEKSNTTRTQELTIENHRRDVSQPASKENEPHKPEVLHRFGNKERPSRVRLLEDLGVSSPDEIIGPYAPSSPADIVRGASMYVDPDRSPLRGKYHKLPADAPLAENGLAVHADGEDVNGEEAWGHRSLYPTEAMTAGTFCERHDGLPWESGGDNKKVPRIEEQ